MSDGAGIYDVVFRWRPFFFIQLGSPVGIALGSGYHSVSGWYPTQA